MLQFLVSIRKVTAFCEFYIREFGPAFFFRAKFGFAPAPYFYRRKKKAMKKHVLVLCLLAASIPMFAQKPGNNLGKSLYQIRQDFPDVQEHVRISNGDFRGNDTLFEVKFDSGIESISIKREIYHDYMRYSYRPETKTIKLSNKESPYRFRYVLDLFIGDNYIPITVTDKFGNSTNYTYKITMEEVKDDD